MFIPHRLFYVFIISALCLPAIWPGTVSAEPVQEQFRGLTLNGNLELAPGKQLSDGLIFIVPSRDGHHRMELIQTLQTLFKEAGISSFAFTVSLLINDRKDSFYCDKPIRHTYQDIFSETDFWLNWVRKRGAKSITMLGHSQGTLTISFFSQRSLPDDINGFVMLAPSSQAYGKVGISRYETRYKVRVSDVLARADMKIAAGQGRELMKETDFGPCPAASVTANAFVNLYRWGMAQDIPKIWRASAKPILIIGGTQDTIAPGIERMVESVDENVNIRFHVVEDAGHFFRDLFADEVVEVIAEFTSGLK